MQKNIDKVYEVAVIGAGASGLMFASMRRDLDICLIEANDKIAQKIKVSGGGKCNITNKYLSEKNYLADEKFVSNLLKEFDNKALLDFLDKNGVKPKIDEKIVKGTYFCNSSNEVIAMFSNLIKNIKLFTQTKVSAVKFHNNIFEIVSDRYIIRAKKLVVASGTPAYPQLNASDIAQKIAKEFGHKVVPMSPALVGFTVQKEQFWFKNLSGISLEAKISVEDRTYEGKLLFAHKGVSGPVILNSSLRWKKGKLTIDFLPNKSLKNYLRGNALISSALPLPKRFMQEFLVSIDLEDKIVSKLSKDEIEKLALLKRYEFSPAGNFGLSKAEVCKGGIDISEIDYNFESKLQKNLYFLGECLDITGELGGYNFQYAFASGYICANNFS